MLCALAAIAACSDDGVSMPAEPMQILVEQMNGARVRVVFDLPRPAAALRFPVAADGWRKRQWRMEDGAFALVQQGEVESIVRRDGEPFARATLVAEAGYGRLEKEYQPLVPYGKGGLLFYTGHFWPRDKTGERVPAMFSFTARAGTKAAAFSARAQQLEAWRSPMNHPAFVYLGPAEPVESAQIVAIVDPNAPQWIRDEIDAFTPQIFAALGEAFGAGLGTKPNLFLSAPMDGDEGRLSFLGDAAPGQFQITLQGKAWREESAQARDIFRRSTVHEAVHLWQAAARPGEDDPPPWIHEGAADAIAAEILVAAGFWGKTDYEADLARARDECAAGLAHGPLRGAQDRGDYRALYACGHVIAVAVSRADGDSVARFWRDFISRAAAQGGYTEAQFYALAAARSANPAFARELRHFVTTPAANPARAMDRLFAAAGR
jgi:hypothetical protein